MAVRTTWKARRAAISATGIARAANDDAALDVDLGKLLAHGIDGGAVGGLFVTPAPESGCGDGGSFRHASHLQHEHAIKAAFVIDPGHEFTPCVPPA